MAVSISTITKSAGWARTDVVLALEEAFAFSEFHGATQSGIVTFITATDGGGSLPATGSQVFYDDVEAATTSGIGTGASFLVRRNGSGNFDNIYVNRPGYGYVEGEYLTLSAEDIGGSANGAVAIGITVSVDGGLSPVGYGSTNQFYVKNVGVNTTFPFGVLRHEIESGKKYGTTYRALQVWSDFNISFGVGNGFHPYSPKYDQNYNTRQSAPYNHSNGATGYQYRFAGKRYVDISSVYDDSIGNGGGAQAAWYNVNSTDGYDARSDNYSAFAVNQTGNCSEYYTYSPASGFRFATTSSPTTHDLKLRVYRSSIDPKFSIFSFSQPTIAGSSIDDNVFLTFFFHNYTSSLWDYDYCYNNAITFIRPNRCSNTNNGNYSRINFDTFTHGNFYSSYTDSSPYDGGMSYQAYLRSAFVGYMGADSNVDSNPRSIFADTYESTMSASSSHTNDYSGNLVSPYQYHSAFDPGPNAIYARTSNHAKAIYPDNESSPSQLDYNAVIKGIPVCSKMIPCPYYLPDDFVLIDFKYSTSETNFTQGDTITVSASEVYEIIQASYNQYTETAGIALCARIV